MLIKEIKEGRRKARHDSPNSPLRGCVPVPSSAGSRRASMHARACACSCAHAHACAHACSCARTCAETGLGAALGSASPGLQDAPGAACGACSGRVLCGVDAAAPGAGRRRREGALWCRSGQGAEQASGVLQMPTELQGGCAAATCCLQKGAVTAMRLPWDPRCGQTCTEI